MVLFRRPSSSSSSSSLATHNHSHNLNTNSNDTNSTMSLKKQPSSVRLSPRSPAHTPKNWSIPFQSAACRVLPPQTMVIVFMAAVTAWAFIGAAWSLWSRAHTPSPSPMTSPNQHYQQPLPSLSLIDYVVEFLFVVNMVALSAGYFLCGVLSVKWPRLAVLVGCGLFALPWFIPAHHPLYAAAAAAGNLFYLMRILEVAQVHHRSRQHHNSNSNNNNNTHKSHHTPVVFSFLPPLPHGAALSPASNAANDGHHQQQQQQQQQQQPQEAAALTQPTLTTTTNTTSPMKMPMTEEIITAAATTVPASSSLSSVSPISILSPLSTSSPSLSPLSVSSPSPSPSPSPVSSPSPLRAGFNGHALETFDDWDAVWRGLFIICFHDLRNCRRIHTLTHTPAPVAPMTTPTKKHRPELIAHAEQQDGRMAELERAWQVLAPRLLRELAAALWQCVLVAVSIAAALSVDFVWRSISPYLSISATATSSVTGAVSDLLFDSFTPINASNHHHHHHLGDHLVVPVHMWSRLLCCAVAWPLYLLRCVCLFMSVSHSLSVLDRGFAMLFLLLGLESPPVQQQPLDTYYLSEFWGGRWNTQTHDMLHRQVYSPLKRRGHPQLGMLMAFAFSAALHAYPTLVAGLSNQLCIGAAAFFILHALFMAIERVVSPPRVLATRVVTFAIAIFTMPLILEPFAAITGLDATWTPPLAGPLHCSSCCLPSY